MVIRMRHTRAHTKNRRSHHALQAPTVTTCTNCGASHRPHHMCLECGFYNGRQVIDLLAKKKARADRIAAKKEAIGAQNESIAETETEAVAEKTPEVNKTEEKKDKK